MSITWGSQVSGGTQLTTVDNVTEEYFDAIDASDAVLTEVEVTVDNESGTVTDALEVRVYFTQEATPDWDDKERMIVAYTPGGIAAEKFSFQIP